MVLDNVVKGRIHYKTFLSEHLMKYSFMNISSNMKFFYLAF